MQIILHRINTRQGLVNTPREFGVEVDIRSEGKRLIIGHDPFIGGEDFLQWISVYDHGTLILNVKEEGLEEFDQTRFQEWFIKSVKAGLDIMEETNE